MGNFLIGLVIVVGGWYLVKAFANAQPAQVRGLSRKVAGGAMIAMSGFLALRGAMNIAMPLFVLGLGLMGQQMAFPNGMPWNRKSPGQASRVATSLLSMMLDHDTGSMDGEVLAGPFKGRKLASLNLAEAQKLHAQCSVAPDQSRALFEAWMSRVRPEWRAQWSGQQASNMATASVKMSKAEALAILGLKDGATADDIRSAHRRLMKGAHPDLGGSDYLAAKINEAKEFLILGRSLNRAGGLFLGHLLAGVLGCLLIEADEAGTIGYSLALLHGNRLGRLAFERLRQLPAHLLQSCLGILLGGKAADLD